MEAQGADEIGSCARAALLVIIEEERCILREGNYDSVGNTVNCQLGLPNPISDLVLESGWVRFPLNANSTKFH